MISNLAQHLASALHNASRRIVGLGVALTLAACAGNAVAPATLRANPPGAPATGLEIRLHFGADADLDLFVTDPTLETVYFGNNPSGGGGQLDIDRRCGAAAPRVETVVFRETVAGRYRVGIDHARVCGRVGGPAPYQVRARTTAQAWEADGEISPGRFENSVLEFEVSAPSSNP